MNYLIILFNIKKKNFGKKILFYFYLFFFFFRKMFKNFLNLGDISFSLFNQTFPKLVHERIIDELNILINLKLINFQVEIIGPFFFANSFLNNISFFLYLPHYIIIDLPNLLKLELIPFHPILSKNIILIFENEIIKNKWKENIRFIIDSMNFPENIPPIPFQSNILNSKTQTTQDITLVVGNSNITLDYGFKREKIFNVDLRITTSFEDNLISSSHSLFCFKLWISQELDLNIIIFNFDYLIYAFLSIESLIKNIHFIAIKNQLYSLNYAKKFPIFDLSLKFENNLNFKIKECNKKINFNKKINISFNNLFLNPKCSTKSLTLLNFDNKIQRTLLISNLKFNNSIIISNNNKDNIKIENLNNNFLNEIFKLKDKLILNDLIIPSNLINKKPFQFAEFNDKDYFIQNGEELIIHKLKPIINHSFFDDYLKYININLKFSKERFLGCNLLFEIENIIKKFPLIIKTSSDDFFQFSSILFSIIFHQSDFRLFNKNFFKIFKFNKLIISNFPTKKLKPIEKLFIFLQRILINKQINLFISLIQTNSQFKNFIYLSNSIFFIPELIDQLYYLLSLLKKFHFKIDSNLYLLPKKVEIPNISYLNIKNNVFNIVNHFRKSFSMKDCYHLISNLLNEIFLFLSIGFQPKNKEEFSSPWFIFINILKLKLNFPEFLILQNEIKKQNNFNKNFKLLIFKILFKGIQLGMIHFWIIFLIFSAKNSDLYLLESEIFIYDYLMIVLESLYLLSSIFFDFNFDDLKPYLFL